MKGLLGLLVVVGCFWGIYGGSGSYDKLNNVLGNLKINIDVPKLENMYKDLGGGFGATIKLGERIMCERFGLSDVSVRGDLLKGHAVQGNGEAYDQYNVHVDVKKIRIQCTMYGLCVSFHHWFGTKQWCGGSITIKSSDSDLYLSEGIVSADFSETLPVQVVHVEKPCKETVALKGISFDAHNVISIFGIDATGIIRSLLNGSAYNSAVDPIAKAICEQVLPMVADALNGFFVANPFTDFIRQHIESLDKVRPSAEDSLQQDVEYLDLQDNIVMEFMAKEKQPNGVDRVYFSGDMIENIMGQFQIGEDVNVDGDILQLAGSFLGVDLEAAKYGRVDLLPMLESLFFDNKTIGEVFQLPGFGTFGIELQELGLELEDDSSSKEQSLYIDLVGHQTLGLPQVDFDRLQVHGKVGLDLNIDTELLDSPIRFRLVEAPSATLDWKTFQFHIAMLLAINMGRLEELEIGPLYREVLDCALSTFQVPPSLADVLLKADSIDLSIGGLVDGISNIVGDLFNVLFPIYKGMLPEIIEAVGATYLSGIELVSERSCAKTEANFGTENTPYDFSKGMVAEISHFISPKLVDEIMDMAFPGNDTEISVTVIGSPMSVINLDLNSLGVGETLEIRIDRLILDFPRDLLDNLVLLRSVNGTQNLNNLLEIHSIIVTLQVMIGFGGKNDVTFQYSVNEISTLIDLFATLSFFHVEGKQLQDLISIDCWVAGLRPYGGVKKMLLDLSGNKLTATCGTCANQVIANLATRISQPETNEQLFDALNQAKENFFNSITNQFLPRQWETTIRDAKARCEGSNKALASQDGSATYNTAQQSMDANAFPVIILLGLILITAGLCTCGCVRNHKRVAFIMGSQKGKLETSSSSSSSSSGSVASEKEFNGSMWRDPSISFVTKVMVPFVIVLNVVLFVLGHVDVVMGIQIEGQIMGVEFVLDNIAEFSILSSTKEMWKTGAQALAIVIILVSICWPYIKLFTLLCCWVIPARFLSVKRRGTVLSMLDRLGKYSLLELFVVAFVLVTFNITVESPFQNTFLPPGLFELSIVVKPLYSLYTFTTALVLSLVLGNVFVVLHYRCAGKVVSKAEMKMEKTPERVSIVDMVYEEKPKPKRTTIQVVVVALTFVSFVLLLVASGLTTIVIDFVGVLATAFGTMSDLKTSYEYSLFSFTKAIFVDGGGAGEAYFGFVLIMTVLFIPCFQLMLLGQFMIRRFSLNEMKRWKLINHIVCAWCATEPLILGFVLVVLEIGTISKGLAGPHCDNIMPFFQKFALPLGLVDDDDVANGCFAMIGKVQNGAYVFLATCFLINVIHICIMRLVESYIHKRQTLATDESTNPAAEFQDDNDSIVTINSIDIH